MVDDSSFSDKIIVPGRSKAVNELGKIGCNLFDCNENADTVEGINTL